MSEDLSPLEREIASMRPRAMTPALLDRLATEMTADPGPGRLADRMLISSMFTGAAAVVVIVMMLSLQVSRSAPVPASPAMATAEPQPTLGDSLPMLARADGHFYGTHP